MLKKKKNKGLTLVEMIIAMAVMGVVFLMFLTVFSTCIKIVRRTGDRETAITGGSSAVDEYRMNFEDYESGSLPLDEIGLDPDKVTVDTLSITDIVVRFTDSAGNEIYPSDDDILNAGTFFTVESKSEKDVFTTDEQTIKLEGFELRK